MFLRECAPQVIVATFFVNTQSRVWSKSVTRPTVYRTYRETTHRLPGCETSDYREAKHFVPGSETRFAALVQGNETLLAGLIPRIDWRKWPPYSE